MVLSNKKLKQKLKTELTLNQIKAESNPPSLKHLLHSSTNKPILSKREKLRKIRPLQPPNEDEVVTMNNNEIGTEGLGKKRKRKVEEVEKQNHADVHDDTSKSVKKNEKIRKIQPLQPTQPPNEDGEGTKTNNEIVTEDLGKKENKKQNDGDVVANEVVVNDTSKPVKIRVKPRWIRLPLDENDEVGTEGSGEKKKKKKMRKVKVVDGVVVVPNEVVVKPIGKSVKKKEKQKKKNMQKKMRKKTKAAEDNSKTEEGSGSNHQEELPQSTGITNTNIITSQENGDASTKVYVGGIPYYSSEDDIRSFFEGCGTITEINCMTFPDTGKFRGIAIISYKTEAAAKRALALDGADMGGFFLKIQPYKATQATRFTPEMKEGYNRIYVGSLSWEITEEELRKFFSNCNIKSIRLGMDKETGEFRGYAHVDFSDSNSLKTALALDQSVLFGRPVRISCAVPLSKKSDAGSKSVAGSKPGAGSKSVAGSKPDASEKSVPSSKPDLGEKSVASSKPGASEKTVAVEKLDAGEEEAVEKPPSSVASGKRKNRMCYGCRQKGHNLSECPNQQTVASTTI